jgi:hypothetical protein
MSPNANLTPQDATSPDAIKEDFPVDQIRRFLEPGPIILVSSAHGGDRRKT